MVGAFLGTVTCGRCGAALDASRARAFCPTCETRRIPAASGSALAGYSGLLSGVQTAHPVRKRLALAIDLAPIAVGVVVIVASIERNAAVASGAALATVLYLVVHVAIWRVRGRSLGRMLLHLRTVDDLTGAPPRFARNGVSSVPVIGLRHDLVTADLARGRDPLAAALAPVAVGALASPASGRDPAAVAFTDPRRPAERSPSVVLVLDTGERLSMESTLLVGRFPVGTADDPHPAFAWPDLSRSLSKTHALLEWSGSVLWVTDLQSANGSALVGPDGIRQPLVPGLRAPAAPGWTVELGERRFEIHPSGVLEPRPSADTADARDEIGGVGGPDVVRPLDTLVTSSDTGGDSHGR